MARGDVSEALAWREQTGATYAETAERFGVASGTLRAAAKRARDREDATQQPGQQATQQAVQQQQGRNDNAGGASQPDRLVLVAHERDGLSPPQWRALELMLAGVRHEAIGPEVGVSARTVHRWLSSPDFAGALADARAARLQAAHDQAATMRDKAAAVLLDALDAGEMDTREALALWREAADRTGLVRGERREVAATVEGEIGVGPLRPDQARVLEAAFDLLDSDEG